MQKLTSFVLTILCLFFANCLKENKDITIGLSYIPQKYIEKKGHW